MSYSRKKTLLLFAFSLLSGFALVYRIRNNIDLHAGETPFECSLEMINAHKVPEDDDCMIRLIREQFILPPASTKPLNLRQPHNLNPSAGQTQLILNLLNQKKNGFFIESGGLDGESLSNTLYLERELGWQGVLIEPGPRNLASLLTKNRKVWVVTACLSSTRYPQQISFVQEEGLSRLVEDSKKEHVDVQCFPFNSILLALNLTQTTIDYFSLDIEGAELDVLRTISWKTIDIKTISVEYEHGKEPKEVLKKYVEQQGYRTAYTMEKIPQDYIFTKL